MGWLFIDGPGNLEVDPTRWAMTVEQWIRVVDACKSMDLWVEAQAAPLPGCEDSTSPKGYANLYDLNEYFVKPWTRGTGTSVALQMNSKQPLEGALMISHSWAGDVMESREALTTWCRVHDLPRNTSVWFCLFANYQPGDEPTDAGPTVGDQLRIDPFGRVIACVRARIGVLILHTTRAEVYDRAWCVYEIDYAVECLVNTYGAASRSYENSLLISDALRVNTASAKCSREDDYAMICEAVFRKGGFDRLNKVVRSCRLLMVLDISVRRGDASACGELLQAGVDVNAKGVRGMTSLHVAAMNGDINIAQALIEYRADCAAIDRKGNCPAHIMPLRIPGEARDVHLFDMLAPSLEVMSLSNSNGLVAFRRFADWARQAGVHGPFMAAQLRVEELQRLHPTLRDCKGIEERVSISRCFSTDDENVSYTSQTWEYCDRVFEVFIWEHQHGAEIDVLWWSGVASLPQSLRLRGVDIVARRLCARHAVKIYCVMFDAFVNRQDMTLAEYLDLQKGSVEQLGLKEPFVLIDETRGTCLPLIWELQAKFSGVVVINCSNFFSEETARSDTGKGILSFQTVISERSAQHDSDFGAQIIRQFSYAPREEDKDWIEGLSKTALEGANPEFWSYGAAWYAWEVEGIQSGRKANRLEELPPLTGMPVLLVVGACGLAVVLKESTTRLQRLLLPEAEIAELPESILFWQVEGYHQANALARLLDEFIVRLKVEPRLTKAQRLQKMSI